MNRLPKVISRGLLAAALALPAVAFAVSPAEAATPTAAGMAKYESNVAAYVNAQRKAHGLKPLAVRSCPDRYAESLASKLRVSKTIYHQSLSRVLSGCSATLAAENIARGSMTSKAQVAMWMKSSGHRANILNPKLTQIGIGSAWSATYGYTTVADFTRS